jgi:hypothetical protein
VDEKSGVQALDRTAPVLPLLPATPQRRSHDYTRHGTTDLYVALNVASGKVISQMTPRHRRVDNHVAQARHAPLGGRPDRVNPSLDRHLERGSAAVVWTKTADQVLENTARYLQPNQQLRTLGVQCGST